MNGLRTAFLAWVLALPLLAISAQQPGLLRICVNQETRDTTTGALALQLMGQVGRTVPEWTQEFSFLPWARCLKMAEHGDFDAVLAGSHSPERARSLAYPSRADGSLDASKRMFNLGFALVRRVGTKVHWDGEHIRQLEGPLGVQQGYSVGQYLRTQGIEVDESSTTVVAGMRKLVAQRIGAMVVNPFNFDDHLNESDFDGSLELVTDPLIQSKPYFLILSKTFVAAHPEMAVRLWKAVEAARSSADFVQNWSRQTKTAKGTLRLRP